MPVPARAARRSAPRRNAHLRVGRVARDRPGPGPRTTGPSCASTPPAAPARRSAAPSPRGPVERSRCASIAVKVSSPSTTSTWPGAAPAAALLHPQPERRQRGPPRRRARPAPAGRRRAAAGRAPRARPPGPYAQRGQHPGRLGVRLGDLARRVGVPRTSVAPTGTRSRPSGVDVGGADQDRGVQGLRAARVPADQRQRPRVVAAAAAPRAAR